MTHRFTIGVEEEFQIVDPDHGRTAFARQRAGGGYAAGLGEQVKPELHQSIVEIGTKICADVEELRTRDAADAAAS